MGDEKNNTPATGNTTPILGAENKPAFQHGRHNGDALCRPHDFIRDTGIRCGLDLLENRGSRLDAIVDWVIVLFGGKADACQSQHQQQN